MRLGIARIYNYFGKEDSFEVFGDLPIYLFLAPHQILDSFSLGKPLCFISRSICEIEGTLPLQQNSNLY